MSEYILISIYSVLVSGVDAETGSQVKLRLSFCLQKAEIVAIRHVSCTRNATNAYAAVNPPRIPLGELTAFFQTH